MQSCAHLGLPGLELGLAACASDIADPLRRDAWRALEAYCRNAAVSEDTKLLALASRQDEDPVVRLAALRVLMSHGVDPDIAASAETDPDALIRAEAIRYLPPASLLEHLRDDVLAVRSVATERLLALGTDVQLQMGTSTVIEAERSDTLGQLIARSAVAASLAADSLADPQTPARTALVILEGFATAEYSGDAIGQK